MVVWSNIRFRINYHNNFFVPTSTLVPDGPGGVCSIGEDLLTVCFISSLCCTLYTILSSAAMQRVRVFEGRKLKLNTDCNLIHNVITKFRKAITLKHVP